VVEVSNFLGIIVGVVIVIVGLILLVVWWASFVVVLKGIIPIFLILIGVGALVYFISEIKSKVAEEQKPLPTNGKKTQ
jgi:hypothetical protein